MVAAAFYNKEMVFHEEKPKTYGIFNYLYSTGSDFICGVYGSAHTECISAFTVSEKHVQSGGNLCGSAEFPISFEGFRVHPVYAEYPFADCDGDFVYNVFSVDVCRNP